MSKFIVHGCDEEGMHRPEAGGVPFMIFCPAVQDWLPGTYGNRRAAEAAREAFEAQDYLAYVEFAHVKLYRLEAGNELWGGKGKLAPVASFTSVAEFERFAGKDIDTFNGIGRADDARRAAEGPGHSWDN